MGLCIGASCFYCYTRYLVRSKIKTHADIKEVIRLDVFPGFTFTTYY